MALKGDQLLRESQWSAKEPTVRGKVDIILWMHFVEEFTRRQLTSNKDILHALAVVATFMKQA